MTVMSPPPARPRWYGGVVGEAQINDRRCRRLRDDCGGLAAATAAVSTLRAHDIDLPETDRDKIFLPFQRLGGTSRKKAT